MIRYKINNRQYNIKTSWKDVYFKEYAELKNPYRKDETLLEKLTLYTDIEPEVIQTFTLIQALDLFRHVAFLETDITDWEEIKPQWITERLNALNEKEQIKINEIARDSWYRLEKSKQIFTTEENPYLAIAKVIKTYLDLDITGKPITEVYGYIDFFLHNLIHSLNATSD